MPRRSAGYSEAIEYEIDGVAYSGMYYLQDGVVTLVCSFGSKKAIKGGMPAAALARMLFAELIRESRADRN
jgi:hypothetical protein